MSIMKESVKRLCNETDVLTEVIAKKLGNKDSIQELDSDTLLLVHGSLRLIEASKSVLISEAIMLDKIDDKLDLLEDMLKNMKTES
jgi:hypothetical protein|nr:MAG TPA: hypothetical protein [Caudoviricetes sp.]